MQHEPARSPNRRLGAESDKRLREVKHRMKISFAGLSDGIDSLVDLVTPPPPQGKIDGGTARSGKVPRRE